MLFITLKDYKGVVLILIYVYIKDKKIHATIKIKFVPEFIQIFNYQIFLLFVI